MDKRLYDLLATAADPKPCRVQFFEDGGSSAYADFKGSGFVAMHAEYANAGDGCRTPLRLTPHAFTLWNVQDALEDEHGNWWFRNWHGVIDDFGDLVEVEVEEFPF